MCVGFLVFVDLLYLSLTCTHVLDSSGVKEQISSSVKVSGLISLVASRRSDALAVFVCITVLQTGMGRMGELGLVNFRFSLWGVRVCILCVDILGAVRVFIFGSCL